MVTYIDFINILGQSGYDILSFQYIVDTVCSNCVEKFCNMRNICMLVSFLEISSSGFGIKVIWYHRMSWEALIPVQFFRKICIELALFPS